jgi:hypothetical protein
LDVDYSDALAGILKASEFGAREHAVTLVRLGDYFVDQVLAQRLFLFYPPHALSLSAHQDFRQDLEREQTLGTDVSQLYRFRYSCDMAEIKYREIVRQIALDHYGYVTTKNAVEAGVPAVELPKLAARGGLENISYGLYRVPDMTPTANDQFAEALLRVGEGAFIHGESVLALFGLADVNPRKIKVAVSRRARPKLPPFVELTYVKGNSQTTFYEGLKAQPLADAILECRGRIEAERLLDAARQARKDGLLTTIEWRRVSKGLKS